MSATEVWLAIASLTVVVVLTRAFFLLIGERVNIPHRAHRALRYAPVAALVALVLPELLTIKGELSYAALNPLTNAKLTAGLIAGVLFFYTRRMVLTIAVGMGLFTLLRLWSA